MAAGEKVHPIQTSIAHSTIFLSKILTSRIEFGCLPHILLTKRSDCCFVIASKMESRDG